MTEGLAIALIFTLVILLAFSAFFSATETAFTSFSHARMKMFSNKKKSAILALKLSKNYNKLLSTLLIGNNIVNISSASIATIVFTFYFQDIGVTLSTIVMTILVLIFGEISPKTIAKERPEEFTMFSARLIWFFTIIFTPLTFLFEGWKKILNKLFKLDKKRPSMTEEEFSLVVTDIKNEGVLNETEHDLIQNTIKYDEKLVSTVMTSANQMTGITLNENLEDIKNLFEQSNFSRIPVFDIEEKNILGILYRADFYEMLLNKKNDLIGILKPVFYTEETEKISILFKKLQRQQHHIAFVKREEEIVGLISMEDILEELVGEIEDKFDKVAAVVD